MTTGPTQGYAEGLAERMLGRRPERCERFAPAVGGDDSWSFRIWLGGEAMLLKVKRRPETPVGLVFYRRIRGAGVPVPALYAFEPQAGPDGQACVIWQWIDGVPVACPADEPVPYDEGEFGRILRTIHDLRQESGFGCLGDDPGTAGPFSNWVDAWHFDRFDRLAERYFGKGYLTRREADALAGLPQRLTPELNQAEPRLLHMGDVMHHGNMILERGTGRILAVIDYVESEAGDPRWELAWLDFYFAQYPWRPQFDMACFRAAYGTDHDADDRLGRFYQLAVLVIEKLLFFDPATPRGRWAIRTVKNLLTTFE